MSTLLSARGFTLIEALIAAALLIGPVAILAQLLIGSIAQSVNAEQATAALTLAQAKLEALRAAPFDFDANGVRVDSPLLAASPPNALTVDTPPYVDALDRFGAETLALPAFVRRWAVTPRPGDPDTLELAVCVSATATRLVYPQCVWSLRTRRP
jgi:type II secretory pathway pseudopilin PulG